MGSCSVASRIEKTNNSTTINPTHQLNLHCNVEVDLGSEHFKYKIKNAEKLKFNYILVVGDAEEKSENVNIRDCREGGKFISSISILSNYCSAGYAMCSDLSSIKIDS